MPKNILIVDDDAELGEELAEVLREEGYSAENTSDSAQGKRLIKNKKYDLYILDYKMSGADGISLLKEAKERNPMGTIIMMSGKPFVEKLLEEKNVRGLVFAVIKKPFDLEDLLSKIKTLP